MTTPDRSDKATEEVDGDGLPFPSKARLAEMQAEGLASLPSPTEWADFTAMLRRAAELGRSGASNPAFAHGMTEIEMSLRVVVEFLQRQPILMTDNAVGPLLRLKGAISDLARGRVSPLFKPADRPNGRPPKGATSAAVIGISARTMSLLMKSGVAKFDAAKRVAKALRTNGGEYTKIDFRLVADWRNRIHEGAGSGRISDDAVAHYNEPLPAGMGADWLLTVLAQARSRGLDI